MILFDYAIKNKNKKSVKLYIAYVVLIDILEKMMKGVAFMEKSQKAKKTKSWCEKLADSKGLPKVEKIDGKMSKRWGVSVGTFVIPAPVEVNEIMSKVPEGKLITINKIREIIAKKHGATIACPITTGIFAWISAHAAEELLSQGKTTITPYWRTLKSNGELNEKYPGGVELQKAHLQKEGFEIIAGKGKNPPKVKDYEQYMVDF